MAACCITGGTPVPGIWSCRISVFKNIIDIELNVTDRSIGIVSGNIHGNSAVYSEA